MKVLTSDNTDASEKKTADASWWPKVQQWESGTYNVGYWSPFAEVWFQTRLDLIRCNEAQPKTAAIWRNEMKAAKNSRKITYALSNASARFLEREGGRLGWYHRSTEGKD